MTDTVRLFAWQPQGHGQLSFFVAAHSEEEARECVDKYVAAHLDEYETDGWGTDYYEMTVVDVGKVLINDNS